MVLIVFGHWLLSCVTFHDGSFGLQDPLADIPWTRWITWPLQAVPVFFLAAGYASGVSWTHWYGSGKMSRQTWVRQRLVRTLGPTGAYLAFISLWSVVVYAPVAHWVWGGGFLGTAGVLDFAGGSGLVAIAASLAGAVQVEAGEDGVSDSEDTWIVPDSFEPEYDA